MAAKSRERRVRPWYVLVVLGTIVVIVWVLVPVPFVRGVVVGAVLALGAQMGGLMLLARRMRRKVSHHLKPPPLPLVRWDFDMSAEDLDGNRVDSVTEVHSWHLGKLSRTFAFMRRSHKPLSSQSGAGRGGPGIWDPMPLVPPRMAPAEADDSNLIWSKPKLKKKVTIKKSAKTKKAAGRKKKRR